MWRNIIFLQFKNTFAYSLKYLKIKEEFNTKGEKSKSVWQQIASKHLNLGSFLCSPIFPGLKFSVSSILLWRQHIAYIGSGHSALYPQVQNPYME